MPGEAKRKSDLLMVSHQECGSCRFFRRAEIGQSMGVCRGGPPTVLLIGHLQSKIQGQPPIPMTNMYWPQVPDSEWCGGYQVRVQSIDLAALQPVEAEAQAE